jgi:hypothetical protein
LIRIKADFWRRVSLAVRRAFVVKRRNWNLTAVALFVGALAWPNLAGALIKLTLPPYERALQTAWCGGPLHESYAMFGHCAACWIGSAMLLITAFMVAMASREIRANV